MDYRHTCEVCGKSFVSKSAYSKYCSPRCGNKKQWAKHKEAEKKRDERRQQMFLAYSSEVRRTSRKHTCDGCIWCSMVDHTKCVMPTCMRKIGGAHDQNG